MCILTTMRYILGMIINSSSEMEEGQTFKVIDIIPHLLPPPKKNPTTHHTYTHTKGKKKKTQNKHQQQQQKSNFKIRLLDKLTSDMILILDFSNVSFTNFLPISPTNLTSRFPVPFLMFMFLMPSNKYLRPAPLESNAKSH